MTIDTYGEGKWEADVGYFVVKRVRFTTSDSAASVLSFYTQAISGTRSFAAVPYSAHLSSSEFSYAWDNRSWPPIGPWMLFYHSDITTQMNGTGDTDVQIWIGGNPF
ncbi:MAG TPA: hypothetical protein VM536_01400 [Chloroflexia bacterium]|nr:hypothetical protein [Chloroflexia bacterium]